MKNKEETEPGTKDMLRQVLYGSKKGTSYIQKFGMRLINVLYSGEDYGGGIKEVARKNLKRCLKIKQDIDISAIINDLKEKRSTVKVKTEAHHLWANKNSGANKKAYKRVVFGEAAPFSGAHLLGNKPKDKKGPYYKALKKYAGNTQGTNLRDQLETTQTLFIDIMTVPLPIDSELRKQWSSEFLINDLSLSSVLFQLALEHYKIKPKRNAKAPKIALMMPPLTAYGIIKDAFSPEFKGADAITNQLVSINDSDTIKNYLKDGIVPSVFSILAMDRSNSPNGDILKKILG